MPFGAVTDPAQPDVQTPAVWAFTRTVKGKELDATSYVRAEDEIVPSAVLRNICDRLEIVREELHRESARFEL